MKKLEKNEKRSKVIQSTFRPAEVKEIDRQRTKITTMTRSDYVRNCVLGVIERQKSHEEIVAKKTKKSVKN